MATQEETKNSASCDKDPTKQKTQNKTALAKLPYFSDSSTHRIPVPTHYSYIYLGVRALSDMRSLNRYIYVKFAILSPTDEPCHTIPLVFLLTLLLVLMHQTSEEHASCGSVLRVDTLVWFRSVQIWCNGQEETAFAVYWVMDGIDKCRVGFLPHHHLKHKAAYDGKLAQIVEFVADSNSPADRAKSHQCYGLCRAVLVEAEVEENKENVPTSPDDEDDDDGMDDK